MTHTTPTKGNLKLVSAEQTPATILPANPEHLGPRTLELMGQLQTTLDIGQQLELFAHLANQTVPFNGVRYADSRLDHDYLVGIEKAHQAHYRLSIDDDELGNITFSRELPFREKELNRLENLLAGLLYPLRNARLYTHAISAALHDPLTGVCNRGSFHQAIRRDIQLARRKERPLSLIVVDLDHFKRINDRFGHSMGDRVLQKTTEVMEKAIRGSDMLFRYGGEEFVILLSDTTLDGAKLLAERLRESIAAIDRIDGIEVPVSASLGIAELNADDDEGSLFDRADSALYLAKKKGRNRVRAAV